ncbi:MAG TPA: cell division protein ZapA [Polyangiaceae bacterium]|nr:cell division protein ZapA [Polyangiaceae bacterium]
MRSPVELRVGGQTYRVVASTDETELQRLAQMVDQKLRELSGPNRSIPPQALVLAAIALAHDLEEEREQRRAVEQRSRELLASMLERIDAALEASEPVLTDDSPRADA